MKYLIHPFVGETRKQIRLFKYSTANIFSSLVWPVLAFYMTYLTYKTFDMTLLSKYGLNNTNQLLSFLITGSVAFNCNWIMVVNALKISHEREDGTLEESFFSPARKLAIIYGRSMGYFLQFCWIYVSMMIPCSFLYPLNLTKMIQVNFLLLILTLVSSIIWGGFVTSLFIISRDSNFLFSLFNTPMELFTGVSFPIESLPKIVYPMSFLFPLTYNLKIIRSVLKNENMNILNISLYFFVLSLLIIITVLILHIATKRGRKTGSYSLY
ncbi:ABC transporter permease [Enterococcus faecalis]|uniref:ABC transporter permease n=1 Tax=Enterococcus faecalis TaxID=1351 RepID=UPI0019E40BC9|nr:ABC transporter permease [Enterococcus faecalis]EGO8510069.1 ABC transporter permease [Enterococcus faecalis]EGO8997122.1 ABC transporter permease [Enterococcus faecalis]EGQ7428152.1 ABC transporter permease [Enterococcus faecalis]